MSKKLLFIFGACILLGIAYFSSSMFSGLHLGSSALATSCGNDMLRDGRETYQKTVAEIQDIDDYFQRNHCSTIGVTTQTGKLCSFMGNEKKLKQDAIQAYDDCRKQLHDSGKLDEKPLPSSISTDGIQFGTRQFVDPTYTCQSAVSWKGNRNANSTMLVRQSVPLGVSFDGGFYKKTLGTQTTLIKIKINSLTAAQIWDPTFSFLGGNVSQVQDIVAVQEYADDTLYVIYKGTDAHYYLVQTELNGLLKVNTQKIMLDITKIQNFSSLFGSVSNLPVNQGVLFLQERKVLIYGQDSDNKPKTFVMNLDGTGIITWVKPVPLYNIVAGQQPDGKIIILDTLMIPRRVDISGTVDDTYKSPTYNHATRGSACATSKGAQMLPDGTVVVYGNFSDINGVSRNCLARLDKDGTVDPTFDPGTSFKPLASTSTISIGQLLYDGQKKLIAMGSFGEYNGFKQSNFVRINLDGSPDTSFVFDILSTGLSGYLGSSYSKIIGRNGDIIAVDQVITPTRLVENKECFAGIEKKNDVVEQLNVCHKDDFEAGIYKIGNKMYVPYQDKIKIYDFETHNLLKTIQRDPFFVRPAFPAGQPTLYYDNVWGGNVLIDGKYLYVGSYVGIDVIDTDTDEIIKTLGYHKPDQVPTGIIPADTLAVFQSEGDVYFIGHDTVVHKVPGGKPVSIQDKYITGDSRHLYNLSQLAWNIEDPSGSYIWVNKIMKRGDDIYVIGQDRMIIIDAKTQEVVFEFKYSPNVYDPIGDNLGYKVMRNNSAGLPVIIINDKLYINAAPPGLVDRYTVVKQTRWYVFDIKTRKIINTMTNHGAEPLNDFLKTGKCLTAPFVPTAFSAQGTNIYMRFAQIYDPNPTASKVWYDNCTTMILDTITDTFSEVKDVPPAIEEELHLFKNSNFFNGNPNLRYANHTFMPSTTGTGYDIIDDATHKKTGYIVSSVPVVITFPTMQYGNMLYTDGAYGPIKRDLSNGELSCTD